MASLLFSFYIFKYGNRNVNHGQQHLSALARAEHSEWTGTIPGELTTQGFKERTGLTRKFLIPLLEFFDREKLALRVGDKRIARKR